MVIFEISILMHRIFIKLTFCCCDDDDDDVWLNESNGKTLNPEILSNGKLYTLSNLPLCHIT